MGLIENVLGNALGKKKAAKDKYSEDRRNRFYEGLPEEQYFDLKQARGTRPELGRDDVAVRLHRLHSKDKLERKDVLAKTGKVYIRLYKKPKQ